MESAVSHSIPVVHPPSAYADDRTRRRKPKPSFAILSEPRRLMAGEALFVVGDAATHSFRILDGAMMILRRLPGGRRQILDIGRRGRTIGFNASDRHDCDAIALAPTIVASLGQARIDQSAAMLAEIARLRDLATLLGRKTALERIASFLVDMIDDGAEASSRLDMPVTRQEIADYLGLVIETVCRNFAILKRRGIIASIGRDDFRILDLDALRQIGSGLEAATT